MFTPSDHRVLVFVAVYQWSGCDKSQICGLHTIKIRVPVFWVVMPCSDAAGGSEDGGSMNLRNVCIVSITALHGVTAQKTQLPQS